MYTRRARHSNPKQIFEYNLEVNIWQIPESLIACWKKARGAFRPSITEAGRTDLLWSASFPGNRNLINFCSPQNVIRIRSCRMTSPPASNGNLSIRPRRISFEGSLRRFDSFRDALASILPRRLLHSAHVRHSSWPLVYEAGSIVLGRSPTSLDCSSSSSPGTGGAVLRPRPPASRRDDHSSSCPLAEAFGHLRDLRVDVMFSSNASSANGIRKKRRHFSNDDSTSDSSTSISIGCKLRKTQQDERDSNSCRGSTTSSRANNKFSHMLKCGDDDGVPTLFDIAAKATARYVTFQQLEEKFFARIPEPVQRRVLFWSFPRDERPLRLYSCPSNEDENNGGSITTTSKKSSTSSTNNNSPDHSSFAEGLRLLDNNCIEETLQIGFHLSGSVRSTFTIDGERKAFRVSMSFDRCKITAVRCNCDHKDVYWCQHVVALALYRMRFPERVQLCLPISESLNQMDRQQLQKFAQYLISRHYSDVLPTAQHLADEVLRLDSEINAIHGAPDPTAGPPDDDLDDHRWFLDDSRMRAFIRCYLSHAGSSSDQFRQLFSKVKAMLKQRDCNGPRLLTLITEQFLEHHWPGSMVSTGPSYLSPTVLEKCQTLWDQLGALWVCVVLNPYAKAEHRSEWIDSLRKWLTSPSCPAENAFCLPNDMFCNAHVYQNAYAGIDNRKPKTIFHRAIDAYFGIEWKDPTLRKILRCGYKDFGNSQKLPLWNEYFPWACARVDSLRAHGYRRESICLSVSIVRNMKDAVSHDSGERWLGHFLDPVNTIFDCLIEIDHNNDSGDEIAAACRDLAMDAALLALSQRRQGPATCVYVRQKAAKQESALLEKLKTIKVDDRLLQTIKQGVNLIFPRHLSEQQITPTSMTSVQSDSPPIPTHSLASYLFQVFLPRDPDLAYGVGLQALQSPTLEGNAPQDDFDPVIARSWRSSHACSKNSAESCQCSLALNLLMAAKDDVWRLKNILKAIRSNVRSAMLIYRLAQDVQREAQVQPDGSSTKTNLLSAAFELGLRVLRMVNNANPSWFRRDMIRWAVSCASLLGFDAMISLMDNWSHLFSPLEAAGTVGPMIWRESLTSQFKFDGHRREALSKSIHRLAWECVSKCPSTCALHALSLCENDPVSFESAYVLVLEAGKSGRMAAEELFGIGRYMERLSLTEKAYQTALMALSNAWIGHGDEASPLVGDVYWTCALAHSLGSLQMSAVISLIVERIHCASVLADILRRCAFPPAAFAHPHALGSSPPPSSIMAIVSSHPDLRRLLSAAMKAYSDTVKSRLCHISPRHYGEFLDFLIKARESFALHEDGFRLFQSMLDQVKSGYKGKKKLVALIEQKFLL